MECASCHDVYEDVGKSIVQPVLRVGALEPIIEYITPVSNIART